MRDFTIENGILYKYNGNDSHVVIPNGVTQIGGGAFGRCTCLTSIEIPNSVTCIGKCAFAYCENLTNIKIPKSVTSIFSYAFYDCTNITSLTIPNSVEYIGSVAFCCCTNLTHIEISNRVASIGVEAFRSLPKIKPQVNANGTLRAFKAFNSDWTCRNFKYEIGKKYHQNGKIACCCNGFHACSNPLNIFNYYNGNLNVLRFAEVELSGEMDSERDKVAASDIKIVRELTVSELAEIYNSMEKE